MGATFASDRGAVNPAEFKNGPTKHRVLLQLFDAEKEALARMAPDLLKSYYDGPGGPLSGI